MAPGFSLTVAIVVGGGGIIAVVGGGERVLAYSMYASC